MKKIISLAVIIILTTLYACKKDFIVKDITKDSVIVNAPANGLVTTSNQVTFWWEKLDGAEKYKVQVVQPNFNSVTKIVADTTVTNTKYTLSLQPGVYQWRIRAENNGGNTAYQTYNLTIDTTSNLGGQLVSVIAPTTGFLTRNKTISFSWNALNAANKYEIVILNSSNGTVKDTTTANTFYSYTFPASSAGYSWKIRAQNDFSISQYITPITFTIDVTPPALSTQISPSYNGTISATGTFSWSRVGAPDARYDSIFIATDTLFTNVISKSRTYQQSIQLNALNTPPTATNVTYWWRLRTVDSVGNVSSLSPASRPFKIN